MRTLKKVLALTLVIAFSFTMMAGATVFTDNSSINAQDQVDLVYALGIIKGYPDGTFGADKTITRAEAAKMIYVIKTGKDEGSDNYKTAANPFTDVSSTHWAKGYINYCYLNGIIAGVGGGKFNPDGQVTGAELAKMLLTVIGYNATKAGLTGPQWLISTMSLAFENDLFDSFTAEVSAAAPREDAAVIFYNTVNASTVVLRDGEYTHYANDGTTLLPTVGVKNFDLQEYKGYLLAADKFAIKGLTIADDKIGLDINNDGDIGETNEILSYTGGGRDMVGQYVKVLYDTNKEKVYNIVSAGDNVVYNTTVGAISNGTTVATQIKFAGDVYTLADDNGTADDLYVYSNYAVQNMGGFAPKAAGYRAAAQIYLAGTDTNDAVRLVDNNGDDTIDYAFITAKTFGYVSSVDSKSIDFGIGGKKFLNDDGDTVVFAEGVADGDYVQWYQDAVTLDYYVEKATTTSVTVDGLKGNSIKANGAYIDKGTKASAVGDAETGLPDIGGKYTVLTDGKYWLGYIAPESASVAAGDYALVSSVQNEALDTTVIGAAKAKVLVVLPGEDDPVEYVLDSGKVYKGGNLVDINKKNMAAASAGGASYGAQTSIVNKVFAYSITSDGKIKLTQAFANYTGKAFDGGPDASNTTGLVSVGYNKDTEVFTDGARNYLLADNAVIFYKISATSWKVYGKGDFDANITSALSSAIAYKSTGGFNYIQTAAFANGADWGAIAGGGIVAPATQNGTASDDLYAFVLDNPMVGKDIAADEDYVEYSVYTSSGAATIRKSETDVTDSTDPASVGGAAPIAKGNFVRYTLKADGTVKDIFVTAVAPIGLYSADYGDIRSYNSSNSKIAIDTTDYAGATRPAGTIYTLTTDTQVIYINKKDTKGETGSSYPYSSAASYLAPVGGAQTNDRNVYFVIKLDTDHLNEIAAIFIDTSETLPA